MAEQKLTGRVNIDFLPEGGEIESADFTGNNATDTDNNPLLWGEMESKIHDREKRIYLDGTSCLGGSGLKLWGGKYDGYNSSNISENGKIQGETGYEFTTPPEIAIAAASGKKIHSVIIWFDETYNEYATKLSFTADNGTPVIINNHRLFVVHHFEPAAYEVSIKIIAWNKPCRCAKIRRIHTSYKREFNADRIVNFNASAEDRPDPGKIEYGLSSQFGSIELLDIDNDFEILNEYALLQDNQPITVSTVSEEEIEENEEIKIIETVTPIGTYLSQDWEISPNDNTIKVNLTDEITRLQNVKLDTYTLHKMKALIEGNNIGGLDIIRKILHIAGFACEIDSQVEALKKVKSLQIVVESDSAYEMVKKILADCKCRLHLKGATAIIKEL